MNRNIYILAFAFLIIISTNLFAQIHINEIMSSNTNTIYSSDGDTPDWIELYNAGSESINLFGYALSDDVEDPFKWEFPSVTIDSQSYLLVLASGADEAINFQHWETEINWGDNWSYFIGTQEPPINWKGLGFDDNDWSEGPSGFGYGDGDDATIVPSVMSVYVRKSFTVESIDNILDVILHVDYDDAFVAYINGTEVARSNIGTVGIIPAFNEGADAWREALIFTGGMPEEFQVDAVLQDGENILSIQVHNFNQSSSDLSLIPFLTLGMSQIPNNPQGTPDILNFETSNLETNFKISSDGEDIILSDLSGFTIDQVDSLLIPDDISYGRQPDGSGTWVFFSEPTPHESNVTQGANAFCDFPEFSINAGVYSSAVEVLITTSSNDYDIFYTLDGSNPTINSLIYHSPIVIGETKVLRAATISSDCISNEIATQTYLINEELTLPAVSITTNPDNLWDNEIGIYVLGDNYENWNPYFGANFWEDWERPIHIEFFEPDGTLGFAQDAGVKIFGGWSRAMAQKSLSIFARSEYGNNEINYQIFPDKNIDSFKSIVLRNSGNDWYSGENWSSNSMFRDGMQTRLMDNSGIDHQAYRPAVVYLNGEYWGIHNIREKVNEEFLASNNPGVDPDELDELEANAGIVEGDNQDYWDIISFIENNPLSNPDNYTIVEEQIDINNFIDYYVAQIFFANTDWPGNNIKFWRPHTVDGKWKWILYDTDFGFGLVEWYGHNTLQFALEANGPGWPNPPWSTLLFRSLMENDEFQNKFINHFCYYLSTRFEPDNVNSHIANIVNNILPEMPRHIQKWGGNMTQWYQNANSIIQFADYRQENVFNHLGLYFGLSQSSNLEISSYPEEGGSLYTSNQEIPENPWESTYFNDIPIEITAVPNPGYIFSHWSGPGIVFEPTITLVLSGNIDFTAIFVEDSDPPIIVINEFLADNESIIADETGIYEDWIELYYNTTQTINLEGFSLTDDLNETDMWLFPDIEISGEGYLLIWVDNDVEDGELHTNFQLSGNGEDIGLFDINDNLIDGLSYGEQLEDISYGRIPDGVGEWQSLNYPTPGESNEISQCSAGDVNCDDAINILDVVQIVSFILGNMEFSPEQEALSDINADGVVNVLDIVQLVNLILDN